MQPIGKTVFKWVFRVLKRVIKNVVVRGDFVVEFPRNSSSKVSFSKALYVFSTIYFLVEVDWHSYLKFRTGLF